MTFFVAAILYFIGFAMIEGSSPGAADATSVGSIVCFFLLWGAVDATVGGLKGKSAR